MSIVAAKAIPYYEMELLVKTQTPLSIRHFASQFDRVWLVSITDPDVPAIFSRDHDNAIGLRFHDADPGQLTIEQFYKNNPAMQHVQFMNFEQARQIADFLVKADQSSKDSKDVLIVNCMMGVARSGAVVDFARQLFGFDYETFKRMNPQIVPNLWVKKLLMKTFQG